MVASATTGWVRGAMIRKIVLGVVAVVVVRMGLTPLELGYSPFALVKAILAAN